MVRHDFWARFLGVRSDGGLTPSHIVLTPFSPSKPKRLPGWLPVRTIKPMDPQRFIQRQQEFLRAASRLQEAVSQQGGDILRDATIQRFEFTFEAAWKTLQLFLLHQGFDATGPRQVLKQAFAFGLIQTPEEADVWLAMLEDRNLTTHTYREALAEVIAANIRAHYAARLVDMAGRVAALKLD